MQEDEAIKLREQLAESNRQYKHMDEQHQKTLRDIEQDLNQRRENLVREIQQRLDQEKDSKAETERNNHILRSNVEDMRTRLAAMEESRDRIQNHFRELEISIEPTRKELE